MGLKVTSERMTELKELGVVHENIKLEEKAPSNSGPGWKMSATDNMNIFFLPSVSALIKAVGKGIEKFGWRAPKHDYNKNKRFFCGDFKNINEATGALLNEQMTSLQEQVIENMYVQITRLPRYQVMLKKAKTKRRQLVYSDEGSELSIDRVMCGDPEHWQSMTRGAKKPIVKLGMNVNGNCTTPTRRFALVSGATAVMADLLTKSGFSVEIYTCSTSQYWNTNNSLTTVSCLVKPANADMDIARIASCGIPAFFRRWVWEFREEALQTSKDSGGYSSVPIPKEFREKLGFEQIIDYDLLFTNDAIDDEKLDAVLTEIINSH